MSTSPPASYKEIALICTGVIISLVILGLVISFFFRKPKDASQATTVTSSASKVSTFAQLNYDRQQEELKKQTESSSLNTPYVTSSNNILYE